MLVTHCTIRCRCNDENGKGIPPFPRAKKSMESSLRQWIWERSWDPGPPPQKSFPNFSKLLGVRVEILIALYGDPTGRTWWKFGNCTLVHFVGKKIPKFWRISSISRVTGNRVYSKKLSGVQVFICRRRFLAQFFRTCETHFISGEKCTRTLTHFILWTHYTFSSPGWILFSYSFPLLSEIFTLQCSLRCFTVYILQLT